MDNQVSDDISIPRDLSIPRGIRQGNPISSKLFTATMQEVFKNAQLKEKGINIDGENCRT